MDRRRIEGLGDALREVMRVSGNSPTELSRSRGISRDYIFSSYVTTMISGKVLDVLDLCGYRLAFVPKDSVYPEGTVLLPDRENLTQIGE